MLCSAAAMRVGVKPDAHHDVQRTSTITGVRIGLGNVSHEIEVHGGCPASTNANRLRAARAASGYSPSRHAGPQ